MTWKEWVVFSEGKPSHVYKGSPHSAALVSNVKYCLIAEVCSCGHVEGVHGDTRVGLPNIHCTEPGCRCVEFRPKKD